VQPEGSEVLYRIGTEAESAEKLAADAARAARSKIGVRKISIHGVSASADPREGASQALRRLIEEHFPVHETPTRANPLHRTIELPNPVTPQDAELFNLLFGRQP
jgi:hypothetical protein